MSFSASKFYIFFMFLWLAILLVSTCEVATKICKIEYNNVTSHGCDKQECNVDCVEREGAAYGHCVPAGIIISFCFCYYKC
ncbi:unnamed protein product [Lathyrus oleraceus]|uniref:Defensin-like protein n=1 Tax=Pisum sativum TaxID=3888 RepID=A0A9D4XQK4_PEA|nr:hypothetical protein KIW84_046095 [Pisum sativum]